MPKFTITRNWIECIGPLWIEGTAAKRIDLSDYDLRNMRDDSLRQFTRDSVEHWLCLNEGDFQYVADFAAFITDEDRNEEIEIPWANEESELIYGDCMWPAEED